MSYDVSTIYSINNKNKTGDTFLELLGNMMDKGRLFFNFGKRKPGSNDILYKIPFYVTLAEGSVFFDEKDKLINKAINSRSEFLLEHMDGKGFPESIYEFTPGGTSAKKLEEYGRPRKDGKSESRTLEIFPATLAKNSLLIFQVKCGGGIEEKTGIITPSYDYKSQDPEIYRTIKVAASEKDFKEMATIALMRIQAYFTSAHLTGKFSYIKEE